MLARFLTGFELDAVTGCWVWGRSAPQGYGRINVHGRAVAAHRFSYQHFKGPIAVGLEIDHLCCNKRCVNPDHLDAVSQAENVRRYWNPNLGRLHHTEIAEIDEWSRGGDL